MDEMMQTASDHTTTAYLLTAIGTLATVVGVLYMQIRQDQKHTLEKLEECEQDREKLWSKIAGLETKINGH